MKQDPYSIIYRQRVTEKARVLAKLHEMESSASLKRCKTPKAVFIVNPNASKLEIAEAVEQIYEKKGVQVVKVNTINVKPKPRNRRTAQAREGKTKAFKKAIVTFAPGKGIEEAV